MNYISVKNSKIEDCFSLIFREKLSRLRDDFVVHE